MTQQQALSMLMRDVGQDLGDYRRLRTLLDDQFAAALRHRSAHLADISASLTTLIERLEIRRGRRVALTIRTAGPGALMDDVFAMLRGGERDALESGWKQLGGLVVECKRLNARNGRLMMDQHAVMQRVLHGEEQLYAPA